jgi:hypothetical protein
VKLNHTVFYDHYGTADTSSCKSFDLEFRPDGSNAIHPGQRYYVDVTDPYSDRLMWEGYVYAVTA